MGKSINQYIKNIECTEGLDSIMTVEHRSNNPKRDYLFCNRVQAKHIPANPNTTFGLFGMLLSEVKEKVTGKRVVVVGFAETATAIGAFISENLDNCVYHLQTSREECSGAVRLIEFQEEHSHATEQFLYGNINAIPEFDYILFVEDEISTGKTILNFIREFNHVKSGLKFGVASICNWQSEENKQIYTDNNIDTFALIRGELGNVNAKMDVKIKEIEDDFASNIYKHNTYGYTEIDLGTSVFEIERTGRVPGDNTYLDVIRKTTDEAVKNTLEAHSALVIGTEESMYIPITVAYALENIGINVRTHSTTRSCIDVIDGVDGMNGGIEQRYKLHSAYDNKRNTYIYNLKKYDKVLIITDSNTTEEFKQDIVCALIECGNKPEDIIFIKTNKF